MMLRIHPIHEAHYNTIASYYDAEEGEKYEISLKDRLIFIWTALTKKNLVGVVIRK